MNVYDFDNTIYAGDSSIDLYFACLRRNPAVLRALPAQASAGLKYLRGRASDTGEAKTAFKEQVYSYFSAVPDMEAAVEQFWDSHIQRIKMWYILQRRPDDVIISASPEFLIAPACARLGIRHQLSSRVGASSGLYLGLNCHGEEKVRRFYQAFGTQAVVEEFYSDALSDTPMARLAQKAFLVKGNRLTPWPRV